MYQRFKTSCMKLATFKSSTQASSVKRKLFPGRDPKINMMMTITSYFSVIRSNEFECDYQQQTILLKKRLNTDKIVNAQG